MTLDRLLGAPVAARRPVVGGYTNARRELVTLADGRTAFAKTAVDDRRAHGSRPSSASTPRSADRSCQLDLTFWLPSLRLEGGPEPEEVGGGIRPELAVLCAGFFACRAGLPEVPVAPRLRAFQRAQVEVALPWAARALGLSRPRPR